MLLCSYFTVQPVASPGVSRRVVLEPLLPYTEYQLVARARLGPATTITSDTVYFSTASRGHLEFSYCDINVLVASTLYNRRNLFTYLLVYRGSRGFQCFNKENIVNIINIQ